MICLWSVKKKLNNCNSFQRRIKIYSGTNTTLILILCSLFLRITQTSSENLSSIYTQFKYEADAIFFQQTDQGASSSINNDDLVLTLTRSWWDASKFLILKSHEQGLDVSSTVRSTVGNIMKNCEELLRLLDKQHDNVVRISPAFQWAQSLDAIYLNIKFAYRWNSPGALSIENEEISCKDANFSFSGIGSHSGVKKKYVLEIQLYDSTLPEKLEWNFASVGKVQVKIAKKEPMLWPRLTFDTKKISNMFVWWDMQEKLEAEDLEKDKDVNDDSYTHYSSSTTTPIPNTDASAPNILPNSPPLHSNHQEL